MGYVVDSFSCSCIIYYNTVTLMQLPWNNTVICKKNKCVATQQAFTVFIRHGSNLQNCRTNLGNT